MKKLLLIDGNSIINRAFYGIMGSKMLMTTSGIYTNGIYGFLAIYFKMIDDLKPEYVSVAFDLKAPTKRHEMYKEYKGTRKGMPEELAQQIPILKDILRAMNITIIEKEGYEADDILGTLSKLGKKNGLDVTILTGDRDAFQLIEDNITVRIPRTKMGKTETEDYTTEKIEQEYGLKPQKLIEVKGLMGDTSDNIPGIPGVGEKTAIALIQEYGSIDDLYKKIEKKEDNLKGKIREKIVKNRDLAELSKKLGTININSPITNNLEEIKRKEWNKDEVYKLFTNLKFNRFIERFNLGEAAPVIETKKEAFEIEEIETEKEIKSLLNEIENSKKLFYYLSTNKIENNNIIPENINGIYVYSEGNKKVSYISKGVIKYFSKIFEDSKILKCGANLKKDWCLLKQNGIEPQNMMFDVQIAGYLLNSISNQYSIEDLSIEHLDFDITSLSEKEEQNQISFFENDEEKLDKRKCANAYVIAKLYGKLKKKLKEADLLDLFINVEMPLAEVLADMQYTGIYLDKKELQLYGNELQKQIETLTKEINKISGEDFNINSPKQLGEVLFDKLKLPVQKKNKSGYSTDVDVLEKIRKEHPVVEKILEYRQISKLNSTFVDGLIPYINAKTNRIHSHFHQTVTATGRISSTDPNMQNIPTRMEIGKQLRKVFKAEKENTIFIDADYSQIELRVLAHVADDKTMIEAFKNGDDIHKQVASKVFGVPINEVTKEMRSKAKAVNFGIVYGISDFGLAEQLGVTKKEAKQYIEQYLEKYSGIKKFMEDIVEEAKQKGYVETILKRRRYVPELKSNNYMVRQFGNRVAMNTPIQGSAADIIKIAMMHVYKELKQNNMKSKLVLQVHDELLIETYEDEKEKVKNILKNCMENAIKLRVPLNTEIGEGKNWYEAKQ